MNNAAATPTKSFAGACREFFGMHPGQNIAEFGAELKALTPEDKLELAAGMRASTGWDISDPIQTGNAPLACAA